MYKYPVVKSVCEVVECPTAFYPVSEGVIGGEKNVYLLRENVHYQVDY